MLWSSLFMTWPHTVPKSSIEFKSFVFVSSSVNESSATMWRAWIMGWWRFLLSGVRVSLELKLPPIKTRCPSSKFAGVAVYNWWILLFDSETIRINEENRCSLMIMTYSLLPSSLVVLILKYFVTRSFLNRSPTMDPINVTLLISNLNQVSFIHKLWIDYGKKWTLTFSTCYAASGWAFCTWNCW